MAAENRQRRSPVDRLDDFCREHDVRTIDLLKLDCQGYEGNVLLGANEMLKRGGIRSIYTEVSFRAIYQGQALFEDICRELSSHGYRLVDLYDKSRSKDGSLLFCDAFFIWSPDVD